MNFNELTPQEKLAFLRESQTRSRMNYDPSGEVSVRPIQERASPLYSGGKKFNAQNNVPVYSLTDMRRNPERYYNRKKYKINTPYMVDLTDAGNPGSYIYNEYGKEYRLNNRRPMEDEEEPTTLRKATAKAKGR